jgi:hypothetical protein
VQAIIDAVVGGAAKIDVEAGEPVTRHTVTMQQIERRLTSATISPNERVKKDRLRGLLNRALYAEQPHPGGDEPRCVGFAQRKC